MPLGDIFKRISSKKRLRDLKALADGIQEIRKNVEEALNRRKEVFQRVITSCEKLKANPTDNKERRRLSWYLNVERRFLDAVRNGIKDAISILEATLKELRDINKSKEKQIKRGKDPQLQREYVEVIRQMQTIQFLVDTMQFAKWKIKTIEKRIKRGEKLEKNDYAGEHLDKFLQTLEDEKRIDRELALVLEGKSKEVKKIWNYVIKDKLAWGSGVISTPLGAGVYYAVSPSDSVEALVATIIGVSVSIVAYLAFSTRYFEESRRNLNGKVGDLIKIPR